MDRDETTQSENVAYSHPSRLAADSGLVAKAEKRNEIDALSEEQGMTYALVQELEGRIRSVTDPEPNDSAKSFDMPPHIANNVSRQREINSSLRSIIRSLVI